MILRAKIPSGDTFACQSAALGDRHPHVSGWSAQSLRGGRHLRFHRHGQARPSPRHRPAARDRPRSYGDGQSGPGPVRRRLMSGCAVSGVGLSSARFLWLPRGPGSDGLASEHPRCGRHGLAEWLAGRPVCPCGQPLVPAGLRSPVRIFSNHGVLAGAPLRNRTVDLLLTMEKT
jgi:hypothetical protein